MTKLGWTAVAALVVSLATGCETSDDAEFGRLPDLVGMGLQAAQDDAQAAGYLRLRSRDALGQGRSQVLDRNWKVCTQQPSAGDNVPLTTQIDLGVVKLDEQCPTREPPRVGRTMLDFVGKSVREARAALPGNASIDARDASGRDRIIVVEGNWKVCSQKPRAGARYGGQVVTLRAVKFGERCP